MTMIKELMDWIDERLFDPEITDAINVIPILLGFKRKLKELAKKDLERILKLNYKGIEKDYFNNCVKDLEDVSKDG